MENETKARIICESLRLFSQKGYDATSVHEIAKAVGIKAPSLYNYFESKQQIFDAIVDIMLKRFSEASVYAEVPDGDVAAQVKQYAEGGKVKLKSTAHYLFHFYLTDEYASRFSKMLSIEKHSNTDAAAIHTRLFIDMPLAYQTEIFKELIKQGYMIDADPHIMALHFFSPMYMLLDKYENNPENESEALELLDRHIEQFCLIYDKK